MADSEEAVDLEKLNVDSPSLSNIERTEEKDVKTSTAKKEKKSRKRKMECGPDASDGQPAKKKAKRGWSAEEEALFVDGLSQFGRDWSAVAKHIGTGRKTPSIRSHAQVWFLKQLRDGHALPAKMLESGHGFTLSGEALNKYSAVATRFFGSAEKVPAVDGVCSDEEAAKKHKRKPKNKKNNKKDTEETVKGKGKKKQTKKQKKKKRKKGKYYDSSSDEEVSYGYSAQTASTTTAVRRSGRARRSTRDHSALHETDPFGLRTDMEVYDDFVSGSLSERVHAHKSAVRMPQPFTISYCANSLVIADLHSHLCLEVEVMGLLGGTYDATSGELRIVRCYPLKEEQQGSQSVAADPSDHFLASERMRCSDGLELVGWYHSHPCFENVPSNTDCHQHYIHKYEDEHARPYIGLIVSSWSTPDTVRGTSHFRFFNSLRESGNNSDAVYTPYECRAYPIIDREVGDEALCAEVHALIERYSQSQYDLYRTDCGDEWAEGKMTRFQKVLGSVKGHLMGKETGTEAFVDMVRKLFEQKEDTWWVTNKPSTTPKSTDASDKENDNSINSS